MEKKTAYSYMVFLNSLTHSLSLLLTYEAEMWLYCRTTYMPMSYLYGKRIQGPITPLVLSLRKEIHPIPFKDINWNKQRNNCCKVSTFLKTLKLNLATCFGSEGVYIHVSICRRTCTIHIHFYKMFYGIPFTTLVSLSLNTGHFPNYEGDRLTELLN